MKKKVNSFWTKYLLTTLVILVSMAVSAANYLPISGKKVTHIINASGQKFYDTGGAAGLYGNNEVDTIVFTPSSPTDKIKITLNSCVVDGMNDSIAIFKGSSISPANYLETNPADAFTYTSTAADGSITIFFRSDDIDAFDGWDATIDIVTTLVPNCIGKPYPANGSSNVVTTTIGWGAVSGATSYDVYFGTNDLLNGVVAVNVANSPYTITTSPATTYFWKVVPKNIIGDAVSCSIYSFTTQAASAPVCSTTPFPSDGAVNIATSTIPSWTAVSGATSYDVYYSTISSTLPPIPNATVASNTLGVPLSYVGTKFWWKVVPKNATGSATGCQTWTCVTALGNATTPSPANSATNVSSTLLSWASVSGATNYDVYFGTNDIIDANPMVNVTVNELNIVTEPNTTYFWKVVAKNAVATAVGASTWSFTTQLACLSSAIPADGATGISTGTILDWNDVAGATSYDVYSSTTDIMPAQPSGTAYISTMSPLFVSAGTKYWWKIVPKNATGSAVGCPTWTVTTDMPAATNPSPANNATNVSSFNLSWDAIYGATSYDLYLSTSPDLVDIYTNVSKGSSYLASGLSASTKYYWKVVPKNGTVSAVGVPTWNFTTQGLSCPSAYYYPANNSTNIANTQTYFEWAWVSNATSYDLIVTNLSNSTTDTFNTIYTYYYLYNLLQATSYSWKVVPKNSMSTASGCVSYTFTTTAPPTCSTNSYPADGATQVSYSTYFQWNSSPNASYYDIYFGESVNPPYLTYTSNTYYYPTAKPNTKYYWKVIPRNNAGSATSCSTYSYTTDTVPQLVELVSPNGGQVYNAGDTIKVNLNFKSNLYGTYVYISYDGGSTYNYLNYNYIYGVGNHTIDAIIPKYQTTSTTCKIRVLYSNSYGYYDESESNFTINQLPPTLEITQPLTGSTVRPNNYLYVYWNSIHITEYLKLYYTTDDKKWSLVASPYSYNGNNNSYSIYLPNTIIGEYPKSRVMLTNSDSTIIGKSGLFTISSISKIKINSPVKNEEIKGGYQYSISYQSAFTNQPSTYLYYSIDNGVRWNNIGNVYPSNGMNTYAWTVPSVTQNANKCILRFETYDNGYVYAYSDTFKIIATPIIAISSPVNYSSLSWGSSNNIYFNSFLVNKVNLAYSLNGGSSWDTIANNVAVFNGYNSYNNWVIPAGSGVNENARLRISDVSNPTTINSIMNYTFRDKVYKVISPNGGETITAGDTLKINYSTAQYTSYLYVQISYDGGTSWNWAGYAYPYNPGTYTFDYILPYYTAASTKCKIRIYTNIDNPVYVDESDAMFTIKAAPPTIKVTAPTAGNFWKNNTLQYIYWNSYQVSAVNIYYTLNGLNWNLIASNALSYDNNSNYYRWSVPDTIKGYYPNSRIKVVSAAANATSISDKLIITNQQPVIVTKPLAGSKWNAGTYQNIELTNRTNNYYYYNYLYLYSDKYPQGLYLGYSYYSYIGTTSVSIYVPTEVLGSKKSVIKAYDSNGNYTSYSDTFEVVAAPAQISVNSPYKDNYFKTGDKISINWYTLSVDSVKVYFSPDNGTVWTMLPNNPVWVSNGYAGITWTAPAISGGVSKTCLIKVVNSKDASLLSTTQAFTVSNKDRLEVIYPASTTDTLKAATTVSIKYRNNGPSISQYFTYYYSSNSGSSWNQIGYFYGMASGDNTISWDVSKWLESGSGYKIKIVSEGIYCESAAFSVNGLPAAIAVNSPDTAEYYISGTYRNITWSSVAVQSVKIDYSTNNARTWNQIGTYNSYSNDNNSLGWTVPSVRGLYDSCFVRITDANNFKVVGISKMFSISNISPIVIVSPNGGESLQAGISNLISFENNGTYLSSVSFYYSLNNGYLNSIGTKYSVESGLNSFVWNIPSSLGESGKYKIVAIENYNYSTDSSNNFFTVKGVKPSINVTTPYASAKWWSYNNEWIYFNATNVASTNIDYSLDGGKSWNSIAQNFSTYSQNNLQWSVPYVIGSKSNSYIRVRSTVDTTIVGLSNAFTVSNDSTKYIILSPNGGEQYNSGNSILIKINNLGRTSTANLYYSVDSGASWNTIANRSIYNGLNEYSWNTLQTMNGSTNVLVKVVDSYSSKVADVSDAVFTIKAADPFITVSTPSNSDWWLSGNYYTVTWNSLNVSKAIVEYSTDAGIVWKSIDTVNASNGYNYHTVLAPTVAQTSYYSVIRVRNLDNSKVYGNSGVFYMGKSAPALTVVSPNGGNTFKAGNYVPVTFNNDGPATGVNIYYSLNGGTDWIYGSYKYAYNGVNKSSFAIPYYTSTTTKALIKVLVSDGPHSADMSDSVFTINAVDPAIAVITPKTNELYWSGLTYEMQWNTTHVTNVKLELSTDNKVSWSVMSNNQSCGEGSNYLEFTAPEVVGKATNCYIRVTSLNDTSLKAYSNMFIIDNEAAKIMVLKPNGGESVSANSNLSIEYSYTGRPRDYCNIYLSTDNGKTRKLLGQDNGIANGNNAYNYFVPLEMKSYASCKIYVEEGVLDKPVIDSSDAVFAIKAVPASIKINRPALYSYIVSGSVMEVGWNSIKVTKVNIEYSTDGGSTWLSLAKNVASVNGDNLTSVTTPAVEGTFNSSQIRVVYVYDKNVKAESDYFTLTNVPISYTIIKPNGGEQLEAGKTYTLSFTKTGPAQYEYSEFRLSTDGGSSYNYIGSVWNNKPGITEWNWTIPENYASNYCKVKVVSNSGLNDVSDSLFAITPAPARIEVNSPYSSAYWIMGNSYTITWNSISVEKVNIQVSLNAGDTWSDIATNVYSNNGYNSYNVIAPTVAQTELNSLIRVVNVADSLVLDESQSFIISTGPASLTINSPKGGEVFKTGNSYFIDYSYIGSPANIQIYASSDGGYNWDYIGNQNISEGKQSFEWLVSNNATISNYYKLYITANTLSNSVVTEKTFSVVKGGSKLEITQPTSYSYIESGSSQQIRWNSMNVDLVNLEYSLDGGLNWILINNSVNSQEGYNSVQWLAPNVDATYANSKIRITATDNNKVIALSESFIISNIARSLVLKYPNGNEVLKAGDFVKMKYINNGPSSSVVFYLYSGNDVLNIGSDNSALNGENEVELQLPEIAYGSKVSYILVQDSYNNNVNDKSDSLFTVIGTKPYINISYPDTSSFYSADDLQPIDYYSVNVDTVNIQLSIDGGSNWDSIAYNIPVMNGDHTYAWRVKDINTSEKNAVIKVSSKNNPTVYSESKIFKLSGTPVSLTITYPNGGEAIKGGVQDSVHFTYTGNKGQVKAFISYDNGENWFSINNWFYAKHGDNKLPFMLDYEITVSDECLIKLVDENNIADTSNAVFSTKQADPALAVNEPSTGDYWMTKSQQVIKWFSWGVPKVNILYTIDNGKTWPVVRSRVPSWNNNNKYSWTVPSTISGTFDAKIRVVDANNSQLLAESGVFTLTSVAPSITILAPVKGYNWTAGNTDTVKFDYIGPRDNASLYFSPDSGASWTLVNEYIYLTKGKGAVAVTIPVETAATSKAMFKLLNNSNSAISGLSNAFNVKAAPASIMVYAPEKGSYWLMGTVKTIGYKTYNVSSVTIQLSTNNGANWSNIVAGLTTVNGENSYNWTVDSVTAIKSECYIRIVSSDNLVKDTSGMFTISNRLPSINALLSDIKVNNITIPDFNSRYFEYAYKVPASTKKNPLVTAVASDSKATISIYNSDQIGYTIITVVAEDGISTNTYSIEYLFNKPLSDATLKDIKLDGTTITGFSASKMVYDIELPAGTVAAPAITVATNDINATYSITKPTSLPGAATINVLAEDQVNKKTYTINFTVATNVNILAGAVINVYPVPTSEKLTITNASNATVYMYNFTGQLIKTIANISNNEVINVSNLQPGVYMLKLNKEGSDLTYRIEVIR